MHLSIFPLAPQYGLNREIAWGNREGLADKMATRSEEFAAAIIFVFPCVPNSDEFGLSWVPTVLRSTVYTNTKSWIHSHTPPSWDDY